MRSIGRPFCLAVFAIGLLSCGRSADSTLVGEWNCPSIGPMARVRYNADHTYTGKIDGVKNGPFVGAGTWRVEDDKIICRNEYGEGKAKILKISRNGLQLQGPDGLISTYQRVR
jgi:hypothetical protein